MDDLHLQLSRLGSHGEEAEPCRPGNDSIHDSMSILLNYTT